MVSISIFHAQSICRELINSEGYFIFIPCNENNDVGVCSSEDLGPVDNTVEKAVELINSQIDKATGADYLPRGPFLARMHFIKQLRERNMDNATIIKLGLFIKQYSQQTR